MVAALIRRSIRLLPSRYNRLLADDKAEAVATTEDMLTGEEWPRGFGMLQQSSAWIG